KLEGWTLGAVPLMLTCRTVYDEVSTRLYENHVFEVHTKPENLLSEFDTVKSTWIPMIKRLSLRICREPNRYNLDCRRNWNSNLSDRCGCEHDDSECMRNTLTEEYKTFIGNWAAFCKRVAEAWHGSPTDRYVVFYLNIRSLETLKDMVEPLKQLPRLRQYAVRFNDFKDQVSYYGMPIIKKTLCSLQSKWDEAKPFRYMDLPEEVQLKILSFTTLVNLHDGIPSACYRCLGRRRNDFCCNDCVFHVEYGKCCCHVVGIVGLYSKQYKAYSTSCSCYRHPLELFRVSKHIYRQS